MLSNHQNLKYFMTTKQFTHHQVHWSEYLSRLNYLICYYAGWLGTKLDVLTCHEDVYLHGENAYMLDNLTTSSPCSRLVSYCEQLSLTQHLSSSPSNMASRLTQSLSLTSHACKSALTQTPLPLMQLHLMLGCFHKMATSFATRDCSMSPTIRTSDWTSSTLITTIAWLDTLASPRQSRISVVSSIGPEWSPLSPITSTHVQCAVAASPSITSLWPSPFPPDRRTTMGLNLNGLHRGA